MTQLVFYAPMKAPNHHLPSGDREVARNLIQALQLADYELIAAPPLRCWDGSGDALVQSQLEQRGRQIAQRLIKQWQHHRPDAWFTYHLYHKAPDWIGPAVSEALDLPYLVAEASIAEKQRSGPWQAGFSSALKAVQRADAIICLNPTDRPALLQHCDTAKVHRIPPFMATPPSRVRTQRDDDCPRIVTVAMMRPGDKAESYRQLADALSRVKLATWRLDIIGDGTSREHVAALFAPFEQRVRLLGRLSQPEILAHLAESDLFAWPAHREAFGMALLEAQMCGLPVVAGYSSGVASIVDDGHTGLLAKADDPHDFAQKLERLLVNANERQAMGQKARVAAMRDHSLASVAKLLDRIVSEAIANHA